MLSRHAPTCPPSLLLSRGVVTVDIIGTVPGLLPRCLFNTEEDIEAVEDDDDVTTAQNQTHNYYLCMDLPYQTILTM